MLISMMGRVSPWPSLNPRSAKNRVAAGKPVDPVEVRGSGEIKEIAAVLSGVVSGMSEYKTRLDDESLF